MHPKDIFLFLIGNRGAIERVAGSWWSLLVGVILVLTSGIARNYDHLDLLRNPEWLYGPFVASFITSFIIFAFVKAYLMLNGSLVTMKGRQYISFLCLYWMTAPCAWLYGIPVETFTDLVTATRWNIAFLAIVSLWRVFLMTRSLAVLTQASPIACLLTILLPASGIMCVGSFYKGLSLVGIMGGVRLPPHTQLLRDAAAFTTVASFWLTIITLFAAIFGMKKLLRARKPLPWRREKAPVKTLATATTFLVIWVAASYPTQTLVQRNHHLSTLIRGGQFKEAVSYASQFDRDDFSTIHYLPPDPYRMGSSSHYRKLLKALDGTEPSWLRETWTEQYGDAILSSRFGVHKDDVIFVEQFPAVKTRIESHPDYKQTDQESNHDLEPE